MITKTKLVSIKDADVQVESEHLPSPDGGAVSIRLTATHGDSKHVHTHTIGAASGEIADYTPKSLQAELDAVFQAAAEVVHKREAVRRMIEDGTVDTGKVPEPPVEAVSQEDVVIARRSEG